jgi:hypothetical protein
MKKQLISTASCMDGFVKVSKQREGTLQGEIGEDPSSGV